MNLHNITLKPHQFFLWLDVESRTTWRAIGAHLWDVPTENNFAIIEWWNEERPPAALCGYRPRRRTMRLLTHTWANRCPDCRTAERTRGIMGTSYTHARRQLE